MFLGGRLLLHIKDCPLLFRHTVSLRPHQEVSHDIMSIIRIYTIMYKTYNSVIQEGQSCE